MIGQLPPEEEEITTFSRPNLKPHPHHPHVVRSVIAKYLLLAIFLLNVLVVSATVMGCITLDAAKDLAIAFIAPLIWVFATIVGFFFGSESK